MRLWIKILFAVIIILALLFSAAYVFLIFKGRTLITNKLQDLTQKKVSLDYLGVSFPLNLEIKNLNIEGIAKVDALYFSPSILGFLSGNIALNNVKIVKPEFTYERGLPTTPGLFTTTPSLYTEKPKKKQTLPLIFKRLEIQSGKINFIDHTTDGDGIKIIVQDINFILSNLYVFPRSVITNFELNAKIPWQQEQEEGRIKAEGWLNLFKKDMQATLKIEDIDGIYLYPYYTKWVDLEKARIEKAKLNFSSNIRSLNNNVTAECHLELTDIVFKARPPEEQEDKAERIATAVLDIFKALNQGKIVLDFTIRTKMDRPEFGFGDVKMAFEEKLAQAKKTNGFKVKDILTLPSDILQGTVKGATDLTTAVISGAASIGKELKKVVEETFKREKKEE